MNGSKNVDREGGMPTQRHHDSTGGLYAIELTGKDQSVWQRWRSRFVIRIRNKVRGFFSRKGPRGKSVEEEADEALGGAVNSLQALLAKASLHNEKISMEIEKLRVDIEKKRAETRLIDSKSRESDAQARLLDSQSRKLELEIEVQQIQTSITYIEGLVSKGALNARDDVNGFYILVRDVPKK